MAAAPGALCPGLCLNTTVPPKQELISEQQQEAKKMGLGRIATQNGASLRKLSYRAQGFDSYFDKS